ncbi:MAG: ABC transporter ATP-binding protein [Pirellulales bacterium]
MIDHVRTFWRITAGSHRLYANALFFLALATLLAYLGPMVIRATIDVILEQRADDALVDGSPTFLGMILCWGLDPTSLQLKSILLRAALMLGLLVVGSSLCQYFNGRHSSHASESIIRRLRDRLYDHLQRLPCSYHDRAETGDLVQRCTSDVETLHRFLSLQFVEIGRALLLLLTVVPILFLMNWQLAFVALTGAPLVVGFSILFFMRIQPTFRKMDEAEGRMTTVLQENLTGIRVVKAFNRQSHECKKFAEASGEFRNRNFQLIQRISLFWPASDLLVFGQQGAVLLMGTYWIDRGVLSVGTLVAFLLLVNMYIWPIRQMGRLLTELGKAVVAFNRIEEILEVQQEPERLDSSSIDFSSSKQSQRQALLPAAGSANEMTLRFDQVSFGYDPDTRVLHKVSFDVQKGETVAILGPSGSGKSTLVSLLLRFYDGYEGSIQIAGNELSTYDRSESRRLVGAVMQQPFLYSKTLHENIALGKTDVSQIAVLEVARIASIHDAILGFDDGYTTLVGERGVTLSGGQRQRIALARALLQTSPILVLDDALSAVDTKTEAMILQSLEQRHGRQTTLVIAHRLSTLRAADRILVLDQGRVEQFGTHQQLQREGGIYQRLWQIETQVCADLDNGQPTNSQPTSGQGS